MENQPKTSRREPPRWAYEDHPRAIKEAIAEERAEFAANQEAEKKRLVKLCNVARSDRGWTDEEWARIKSDQGGADSLKDMDIADLEMILDYAKSCGFKVRHKVEGGGKSRPIDRTDPARKLRKLWLRGHALGIIKSADEAALCSWASNSRSANVTAVLESFGAENFHNAIERLKKWLYREISAGRLVCPVCNHESIPTTAQATSVMWERRIDCGACPPRKAALAWKPSADPAGGRTSKTHARQTGRGR